MQKLWSANSTLGQEKHVYAYAERSIIKFFYAKIFQGNNHQWVLKLFKQTREGGGIHTLEEKIHKRLTKLWMDVVHFEFSSTLSSMHPTPPPIS